MTDAADRSPGRAGSLVETWRRLGPEQRAAGVGAALLVVSTFGPFSLVEAAVALTGLALLALLKQRADRRQFHLPFGDGTVVLAAGLWAALLIAVRIFDRPFGQSALALGCAALVAAAGLRERVKRPADDVPGASRAPGRTDPLAQPGARPSGEEATARPEEEATARSAGEEVTARLADSELRGPADQEVTSRLDRSDGPSPAP